MAILMLSFIALPAGAQPDRSEQPQTDADQICAARCVRMILELVSTRQPTPPLAHFVERLHAGNGSQLKAASCADIVSVLNDSGVHWRTYAVPESQIARIPLPAIVHTGDLNDGHFRILLSTADGQAVLWDGIRGVIRQSGDQFRSEFSRHVIADADFESASKIPGLPLAAVSVGAIVWYILRRLRSTDGRQSPV